MHYETNTLQHFGIKGQKWGVRRFQNDDGSLTPEGRERYGNSEDHSYKDHVKGAGQIIRKGAKSSHIGRRHLAELRASRLERKAKEAREWEKADYTEDGFTKEESDQIREASRKRAEKFERRAEAQRAANANRKAYEDHTSTKKLVAQDLLLSKIGAQNYRAARARGAGRLRSLLEAGAGVTPIATVLAMSGNKKKYGSRLVLSGLDNGRSL